MLSPIEAFNLIAENGTTNSGSALNCSGAWRRIICKLYFKGIAFDGASNWTKVGKTDFFVVSSMGYSQRGPSATLFVT